MTQLSEPRYVRPKSAFISKRGFRKLLDVQPSSVKRILVIRHAALGDMLVLRPFLIELRSLFPNAEIVLSVASHYQYGAPKDLVDDIHVLYGTDMRDKSLYARYKNIKAAGSFDLIFDLAASARSRGQTIFTPAKLKMGFPYKSEPWVYDVNLLRSDLHNESEVLLEFLYLFGHKPTYPLQFNLPVWQQDQSKKEIVYFMGSSSPSKNFPVDAFLRVIGHLAQSLPDYTHVILQGKRPDEKYEDEALQLRNHSNVRLQKFLSLDELIEYISKVQMVVSNDTSVRHVALATHTPSVGIFSVTGPYRYIPRYEPQHDFVFGSRGHVPKDGDVIQTIEALTKRCQALFA